MRSPGSTCSGTVHPTGEVINSVIVARKPCEGPVSPMATLLMIESWLQSTGEGLPPLLRALGHDYVLVTRDPGLYGAGSATPHPALAGASEVVVVETNDTRRPGRPEAGLAASRPVDGVLTTCDYYLAAAAAVADAARACPGRRPT